MLLASEAAMQSPHSRSTAPHPGYLAFWNRVTIQSFPQMLCMVCTPLLVAHLLLVAVTQDYLGSFEQGSAVFGRRKDHPCGKHRVFLAHGLLNWKETLCVA